MGTKIDGSKLKQALEKYGSLEKATEQLQNANVNLEKQNNLLKTENVQLQKRRDNTSTEITTIADKLSDYKQQLKALEDKLMSKSQQYTLFESFLAMLVKSSSVENSLDNIIALLNKLCNEGWQATKNMEDLRSLFIRNVMGDYLKCFHCDRCDASFLVNKKPYYQSLYNYYECPACHSSLSVKTDDSFLKSIVSEEQLNNSRLIETVQKEFDTLKPFKAFFSLSCDICKKPVTEWTELTVKRGIEKLGWGHDGCFNTPIGQLFQITAAFTREKRN